MSASPFAGIDVNEPDASGYTALHKTCLTGNWEMVGQLIAANGDPLKQDKHGRDAIWFANLHLKAGRAMAAKELFKGGADMYDVPEDLGKMTDQQAKQLGKEIYDQTLAAVPQ